MRATILLSLLLVMCLAPAVSGQQVIAANAPGNPLRIRDVTPEWTEETIEEGVVRQRLGVTLVVENTADVAIRVFELKLVGVRESDNRGFGLEHLEAYELLQPGESRKLALSKEWYDEKPRLLKVTGNILDYIYGSARFPAEALRAKAAFAAGKKAGLERLRAEVKSHGMDATIKFLDGGGGLRPEAHKSNQGWGKWEIAFDTGVNDVAVLFLHANKTGGLAAAEAFLRTP